MKKISFFTIFLLVGMTSCKKSTNTNDDSSQTVEVTLAENTNYEYSLGKPAQDVTITADASHAQVSKISNMPFSPAVYQYMPDSNYVGEDVVTVVVSSKHHSACKGHEGACKKQKNNCKEKQDHGSAKTTYTFKFMIGTKVQN